MLSSAPMSALSARSALRPCAGLAPTAAVNWCRAQPGSRSHESLPQSAPAARLPACGALGCLFAESGVGVTPDGQMRTFAGAPDGWPMLAIRIVGVHHALWATEERKYALQGADGLYWHRDRLITLQNGFSPQRVLSLRSTPPVRERGVELARGRRHGAPRRKTDAGHCDAYPALDLWFRGAAIKCAPQRSSRWHEHGGAPSRAHFETARNAGTGKQL